MISKLFFIIFEANLFRNGFNVYMQFGWCDMFYPMINPDALASCMLYTGFS